MQTAKNYDFFSQVFMPIKGYRGQNPTKLVKMKTLANTINAIPKVPSTIFRKNKIKK